MLLSDFHHASLHRLQHQFHQRLWLVAVFVRFTSLESYQWCDASVGYTRLHVWATRKLFLIGYNLRVAVAKVQTKNTRRPLPVPPSSSYKRVDKNANYIIVRYVTSYVTLRRPALDYATGMFVNISEFAQQPFISLVYHLAPSDGRMAIIPFLPNPVLLFSLVTVWLYKHHLSLYEVHADRRQFVNYF